MRSLRSLAIGLLALIGSASLAQDQPKLAPTIAPPVAAPAAASASGLRPVPTGSHALTEADVEAWLDGYMPYALHSGDIAGATIAVVKDGQVLSARGYGYADVARRTPVDPARTLFRPGSVSKLITWTAVMQLVDQGKLDLDVDVNRYIDFKIPPRNGKPVTLRNIMTHTAGFEEVGKDLINYDQHPPMPLGAYLKRYVPQRIFAPGTTPAYSNWATSLAGYIVERASGMPFADYVEQRIFTPLGMTSSTFRQPLPANLAPRMAKGYAQASEDSAAFEIVVPSPAGAMTSTATDMAKFMLAHLQGGKGILGPAAWKAMHDSPLTIIPPLNRMELGFFETNVNGRQVNAHLGDTQGFHTSLHLFMNEGVGLFVSFNSSGKDGAAGTLRSTLFHDFADRYYPAERHDALVDAKTARQHAALMAGNWLVSRRWESSYLKIAGLLGQPTISTDSEGYMIVSNLVGPNGVPRRWTEIAPFVWRDRDGPDRLAVKLVDGKPVRWSMDFMSPFMVYDRVPTGESAAWILPTIYASLGIIALTFLFWPTAWLVRRSYKGELTVAGTARKAYRATRIMAGLVLALFAGWMAVLTIMLEDASLLNDSSDPWIWLIQILGAVILVGAVAISGWNAWLTWRDGRKWTRKLWSALVLLACLLSLYVAHTFGLLAMTVNY
ncbi:MAG TPA: serine hydrolase domain-containing protein [Novosphingobium sp.]|nr:serine hydrolase domain-containing protein [Novosphingobium sp.]